ncbi:hypothetical protein R69927_01617 [Paraburkholderia domus]|uniref:Uncharacterized protein n=1 Tax=Paraburkholderia domus TaxID=2793075 RepID=A0A9N8MT92_9BURK|nr:hypothetical protein R75483_00143 [Paraburkholderia domus]CAE6700644.1 hypothetical protein R70006_00711 [Paraburkholderia domus]CAE6797150.1 hypothetical protein R69749_02430 [Paraburkholderia domus]CAE6841714.1 hypothetical protein R69927_01617 [Paraburkholderia domus]CAE6876012.1 hypothetical protein R70199_02123 [Paraburkholderia domus]
MAPKAGGGNPQLPLPGYAGYFVFENYTPSTDVGFTEPLNGGTEHALGSATASDVTTPRCASQPRPERWPSAHATAVC